MLPPDYQTLVDTCRDALDSRDLPRAEQCIKTLLHRFPEVSGDMAERRQDLISELTVLRDTLGLSRPLDLGYATDDTYRDPFDSGWGFESGDVPASSPPPATEGEIAGTLPPAEAFDGMSPDETADAFAGADREFGQLQFAAEQAVAEFGGGGAGGDTPPGADGYALAAMGFEQGEDTVAPADSDEPSGTMPLPVATDVEGVVFPPSSDSDRYAGESDRSGDALDSAVDDPPDADPSDAFIPAGSPAAGDQALFDDTTMGDAVAPEMIPAPEDVRNSPPTVFFTDEVSPEELDDALEPREGSTPFDPGDSSPEFDVEIFDSTVPEMPASVPDMPPLPPEAESTVYERIEAPTPPPPPIHGPDTMVSGDGSEGALVPPPLGRARETAATRQLKDLPAHFRAPDHDGDLPPLPELPLERKRRHRRRRDRHRRREVREALSTEARKAHRRWKRMRRDVTRLLEAGAALVLGLHPTKLLVGMIGGGLALIMLATGAWLRSVGRGPEQQIPVVGRVALLIILALGVWYVAWVVFLMLANLTRAQLDRRVTPGVRDAIRYLGDIPAGLYAIPLLLLVPFGLPLLLVYGEHWFGLADTPPGIVTLTLTGGLLALGFTILGIGAALVGLKRVGIVCDACRHARRVFRKYRVRLAMFTVFVLTLTLLGGAAFVGLHAASTAITGAILETAPVEQATRDALGTLSRWTAGDPTVGDELSALGKGHVWFIIVTTLGYTASLFITALSLVTIILFRRYWQVQYEYLAAALERGEAPPIAHPVFWWCNVCPGNPYSDVTLQLIDVGTESTPALSADANEGTGEDADREIGRREPRVIVPGRRHEAPSSVDLVDRDSAPASSREAAAG